MVLTTQQEEQFLKKYDKFVWKVVNQFCNKSYDRKKYEEDLHSLCTMTLLSHLRAAPTLQDVLRMPVRTMNHVMSEFILGSQPLSYPRRTSKFTEVIKTVPPSESLEDHIMNAASISDYDVESVLDQMCWDQFVSQQTPINQEIIRMKMAGSKNTEIASALNLSATRITRRLQQMRDNYKAFVA